ncbi:efflux RND transporter periplasmic adaptor subunit [Desulfogranum mediterraneum]|uniref:efflux RND transporter periplasmic adaptor subunit n=1 Tax=Desulfogranum mediterraneum TaxID=160661 RepID=UPI0003FA0029|nr:efflux RND transporter periplasmic adaptor subunit [Desulfogranum mediterraneum]
MRTPSHLLLLVSSLLLSLPPLVGATSPQAGSQAVGVSTTLVRLGKVPVLVEVVGTLQAVKRASLAAKVTGVVTRVPVVLGSKVAPGELLVSISAEEITAQLKQAEAQLKEARRNLEREKKLLRKEATTAQTVKSMEDRYSVARAAFQEAQTMLGYTRIHAPFSGVITQKKIHEGDLASPGVVLLRLEDDQQLQVVAAVPESLVLEIEIGDSLTITIPAVGVTTRGVVAEIAPAADPASRTAPITIDLPRDAKLRTGQFARVLLPGAAEQTLFIPREAVRSRGQLDRVFVVEEERARLRLVRTGRIHQGMVEILSGLDPEERVVTSSEAPLVNGQQLKVQP